MNEITLIDRVRGRLRRQMGEPFDRRVLRPLRRLRNAGRAYRPIYVGGASGSGTSLLAVSMGQRFDCAGVIYESNLQVDRSSFLYVPDIDDFASVADYQRHMTPTDGWSVERGRRDMLEMYRAYTWGPSDVVIDKGPDTNLLRVDFLTRCFPEARFVLIFRDPVANVEGLRRKWKAFGRSPVEDTIRFYRDIHESYLRATERLEGRAFALEYESLVEDPTAILGKLGALLGLAAARKSRRLRTFPNVEGRGIRNVRRSEIGVVRDANQSARQRLLPQEIERIEAALAPLHRRLEAGALRLS